MSAEDFFVCRICYETKLISQAKKGDVTAKRCKACQADYTAKRNKEKHHLAQEAKFQETKNKLARDLMSRSKS